MKVRHDVEKTRRLALSAMLTVLALGLSYAERFIPLQLAVPLPGVKLGLANIVTLFALYYLGTRQAVFILVLRCALGSMFGGGVTAFFFSVTGGILAMTVMTLTKKIPVLSIFGVSICGAAAHNVGQIAMASLLMRSAYVGAYLPFLLVVSVVMGTVTGVAASACFGALNASGWHPRKNEETFYDRTCD